MEANSSAPRKVDVELYKGYRSAGFTFLTLALLASSCALAWAAVPASITSDYLVPLVISDETLLPYGDPDWPVTMKVCLLDSGFLGPGDLGIVVFNEENDPRQEIQDRLAMQLPTATLAVGGYLGLSLAPPFTQLYWVRRGLDERLDLSSYPNDSHDWWVSDGCPPDSRIMICPIIDGSYIDLWNPLVITGFVSVFVDDYDYRTQQLTLHWIEPPFPPPYPDINYCAVSTIYGHLLSYPEWNVTDYQYAIDDSVTGELIANWTSAGDFDEFGGWYKIWAKNVPLQPHTAVNFYLRAKNAWGDCGLTSSAFPISVVRALSPGRAKQEFTGTEFGIPSVVVTAVFPGLFYVQDARLRSGIGIASGMGAQVGDVIDVIGVRSQLASGEPAVSPQFVVPVSIGGCAPAPTAMSNRSIAGHYIWDCQGNGRVGASNVGLLVRAWGKFARTDPFVPNRFTIDDGSGEPILCLAPEPVGSGFDGKYVVVTGISSYYNNNGLKPMLRIRSQSEIIPVWQAGP